MKSTSRRLTAVLLAAMLGFTSFSALNAYAAETDGKVADAAEATVSASAESTEATTDPAATAATFPATLPTVPQTTVPETTVPETTEPATTVPAPQVGRVTGLGKNTTNVNNINMVWNAVEGADGYVIYRCSADYDKPRFLRGQFSTSSVSMRRKELPRIKSVTVMPVNSTAGRITSA